MEGGTWDSSLYKEAGTRSYPILKSQLEVELHSRLSDAKRSMVSNIALHTKVLTSTSKAFQTQSQQQPNPL